MSSNDENIKLREEIELLTKELNMLRGNGSAELSVIIMLNDDCRFADCFDTLFAQVYSNYEVICMYSGISDEVMQELKRYQAMRSNFNVYYSDTFSESENLNTALSFARGKYVMVISPYVWLSSDHALSDAMEAVKEGGSDAAFGKTAVYKSDEEAAEDLNSCLCSKEYLKKVLECCNDIKYYFSSPLFAYLKNESENIIAVDDVICVGKSFENNNSDKYYSGMYDAHGKDEPDLIEDYLRSVCVLMEYYKSREMFAEYSDVYNNLVDCWLSEVTDTYSDDNTKIMALVSKINQIVDINLLQNETSEEPLYENDIFVRLIKIACNKSVGGK